MLATSRFKAEMLAAVLSITALISSKGSFLSKASILIYDHFIDHTGNRVEQNDYFCFFSSIWAVINLLTCPFNSAFDNKCCNIICIIHQTRLFWHVGY